MSLTNFLSHANPPSLRLDRSSLKRQSTELLRSQIINGRIPQGTRMVEQEIADLMGISRMPARDALIDLEHEGLIVSKPNGRYVIELGETDIQNLFQVRLVLERLAAGQAALQRSPESDEMLRRNLQQMSDAIAQSDRDAYVKSDLAAHQIIWQQAQNPYLLKMLNSIIGPIFMFISSHTDFQLNWGETLQMHEELTQALCAGNADAAIQSIEGQLNNSLELSQRIFEKLRNQEPS